MSKVKKNKTHFFNKPRQATLTNDAVKKKKKHKKKQKSNKSSPKDQKKPKVQQPAPPTDPQQLSANWKILQEILKASQPEKKTQPETKPAFKPKHQNGFLPKKAKEVTKDVSKNINAGAGQKDAVKKVELASSSEENPKVSSASEAKQSTAPKRKQGGGNVNTRLPAKKKKSEPETTTKPTEDDFWFDDVDPDDVEATMGSEAAEIMRKKHGLQKSKDAESVLVKERAFEGITKVVAIDCEMVGVGPDGEESILARVSLVNQFGKCIYDKYVKPTEKVTDYRTAVSGIRPEDIRDGEDVRTVQREVGDILQGRIVVGHAIHNDLKILLLDHPKKKIRDTQKYKPFRKIVKSGRPSLKVLCREILNVKVQQGEHSSVQDAQAAMRLYTMAKKDWEAQIKSNHKNRDSAMKNNRKPKSPKSNSKGPVGL
ncbi:unnamed protein product [Ophioblennius macclurei]